LTVQELILKLLDQNPTNLVRFEGGWDGEGFLTIYDCVSNNVVESWEDEPPVSAEPIDWDNVSDSTKELYKFILENRTPKGTYAEELKKFIREKP
jgi:hypothetical protein